MKLLFYISWYSKIGFQIFKRILVFPFMSVFAETQSSLTFQLLACTYQVILLPNEDQKIFLVRVLSKIITESMKQKGYFCIIPYLNE